LSQFIIWIRQSPDEATVEVVVVLIRTQSREATSSEIGPSLGAISNVGNPKLGVDQLERVRRIVSDPWTSQESSDICIRNG
jgi:hypothetical protein